MMRSILLALTTVATAKLPPAFPCYSRPYDVVPMTGKRGGGFIFDTNAIHKGTRRRGNQPVAETRRDNLMSTQARCLARAPAPCSS